MDEHERFMRLALEQALSARRAGEVPVGAVVVLGDSVVGRAHNAALALSDPTAHAEVLAIRAAAASVRNYRLTGAVLYSTVEPCLMCLGAAMHARIARIVYGAADPKAGAVARVEAMRASGAGFNHRVECSGGVLAAEAASLLLEFFRERRQPPPETSWIERGEVPKRS